MILTLNAQGKAMDGLAMFVIKAVLLQATIIRMLTESSEPLTLQGIYLTADSRTKCLTLQTSYGYAPSVETNASSTSSSTTRFAQQNPYGVGSLIVESIRMFATAMLVLLEKAITTAHFFKSHFSEENK